MSDKWTPGARSSAPVNWTNQQQDDAAALLRGTLMGDVRTLEAERDHLRGQVEELTAVLAKIIGALNTDSRQKDIIGDEVEYHIDGQTMGYALNLARSALAKVRGLA